MSSPNVLLILDGYGIGENSPENALFAADTPVMDKLLKTCPNTLLSASGLEVGLPAGQIGNSEVGHTNIGAGRVVFQALPRISNAISDGSFFTNPVLLDALSGCKAASSRLHILGLLSDGGVHSHITHILALVEAAKNAGIRGIYIHAFLDGRDVSPCSGAGFIADFTESLKKLGAGKIATVCGRYYAMDRDNRWERLQKAYDAMILGSGEQNPDPAAAVKNSYAGGVTDEFVEPIVCDPAGIIKPGDSVVFANFRPDRARELTWALTDKLPAGANMRLSNSADDDLASGRISVDSSALKFCCMAEFDENLPELPVLFPSETLSGTLGEYLSSLGLKQLRIAETEKYAHVTFFFNGGVEKIFPGEDRVLIPSPKEFPTYDLIPEMSAVAVTDEVLRRVSSGEYDVIIINLANCDMVGHTGVVEAAVKAAETVDECVGRITSAVSSAGGITLVTADHGNSDKMFEPDGTPYTAHTTNPVPLIICGADAKLRPGKLADIAPTLLELMGLEKPAEMTGESLINC